jgi:hypothetical protein
VAILNRTTGLTEPEEVQIAGGDAAYWDVVHDSAPATVAPALGNEARVAGATAETVPRT